MAKVIFSVQYEINPNKREDYLTVVRELKNLLKAEGLESYNVYEVKSKANHFQELFTFSVQWKRMNSLKMIRTKESTF
ncbi:MAG: hypothetical protein MZV64_31085 [Ignavibacteriales bacterium]|nr:hypothetical protein [Ignavibacteriales bacterium]